MVTNPFLETSEDGSCFHGNHRNPIHCIIPPYLLEEIARNGNARQRAFALNSLQQDISFRNARTAFAEAQWSLRSAWGNQLRAMGKGPTATVLGEPVINVFTANNMETIPGTIARVVGDQPTGDNAVDEAFDGLMETSKLYAEQYGRDSIDNLGMPLDATVHYGDNYDNAFWDGSRMVFGDGDPELFNRFTIAIDVIGHELTHGVTEKEAGLIYWEQPGALNESVSDVFGSLVKQYRLQQDARDADWLIGEGLLRPTVNGQALRSMKAPGTAYDDPLFGGKDPQPAHMRDYVNTFSDNRGVHINSGIPNHAFYLAAVELGGRAWERAGLIWYVTLQSPYLRRTTRFRGFAMLTVWIAGWLFGRNSPEQVAVRNGWHGVGIEV